MSAAIAGKCVRVAVEDQGRAYRGTIWNASSTSSIVRTRPTGKRAGTGLGLRSARGFVEAIGGTISAGNRATGNGAVFTIVLPMPIDPVQENAA